MRFLSASNTILIVSKEKESLTHTESPVAVLDFCNTEIAVLKSRLLCFGDDNVFSIHVDKLSIVLKSLNVLKHI